MTLPIFENQNLLKKVEEKFNVSICQDTNYSDQNSDFYRFEVCKDKNSATIGKVIFINSKFTTSSNDDLLKSITSYMNESC